MGKHFKLYIDIEQLAFIMDLFSFITVSEGETGTDELLCLLWFQFVGGEKDDQDEM